MKRLQNLTFGLAVVLSSSLLCAAEPGAADPGVPSTVVPGSTWTEVYAGGVYYEGPAWIPSAGKLFFTAHKKHSNQILRLDGPGKVTVWVKESGGVGGLLPRKDGSVVATQAEGHGLQRFSVGDDGPVDLQVLHHNPKWNQPNDLCGTPNGNIYMTDPDFKNRKTSAVYLWSDGKLTKIIDEMPVPNGIIASLDGKTLYVGDSHRKHWRAYPIQEDGTVGEGRVFFAPETENKADPDGMSIDEQGNLYLTGLGGVWVVSPEGKALGMVPTPMFASNVAFGGEDGKTLFVVGSGKVLSLPMNVRGAPLMP